MADKYIIRIQHTFIDIVQYKEESKPRSASVPSRKAKSLSGPDGSGVCSTNAGEYEENEEYEEYLTSLVERDNNLAQILQLRTDEAWEDLQSKEKPDSQGPLSLSESDEVDIDSKPEAPAMLPLKSFNLSSWWVDKDLWQQDSTSTEEPDSHSSWAETGSLAAETESMHGTDSGSLANFSPTGGPLSSPSWSTIGDDNESLSDASTTLAVPITTLMICDVPSRLGIQQMVEAIDKLGFAKTYNLVYRKPREGYGFVNFKCADAAKAFQSKFQDFSFRKGKASGKRSYTKPAHLQGFGANMKRHAELLKTGFLRTFPC